MICAVAFTRRGALIGRLGQAPATLGRVSSQRVPGGVVHTLPADLRKALIANMTALDAWKGITPLARNEFICWVEDAKQVTTRERRIRPDPGGAGGRPAPALLLAGVQAP
jgi:hypothetical protein